MRARFDMLGVKKLMLFDALTIHQEVNYNPNERTERISKHTINQLRKMHYPSEKSANKNGWGR